VSLATWIGVALAGGAGALVRHWVGRTIVVNLTGAFALGVVVGAGLHGDARTIVGAGFLGAYTTFSTWMLQAHRPRAVLWPLFAGLAAIALGRQVGKLLWG
jgi:CrcB protein